MVNTVWNSPQIKYDLIDNRLLIYDTKIHLQLNEFKVFKSIHFGHVDITYSQIKMSLSLLKERKFAHCPRAGGNCNQLEK